MKRKILAMITIGSIFLMALTGCGDSSGNRTTSDRATKSDVAATDVAERPDSSEAEMTKAEAEIEAGIEEEIEAGSEGGTETEIEEESVTKIENPVVREAGLYQSDGSFIPWDNLNIDVETDYDWDNYETEAKSPYKVFTDNNYGGELVLPDNITSLGEKAFVWCRSLTSIDLSNTQITVIGMQAFNFCTSLTHVDLPDTLTSIGDNAFDSCESLTSIDFSNTQMTRIGYQVFLGCSSLTNIDLSNTQMTDIGVLAFLYCYSLIRVDLPENIISIEASAFQDCISLTNINYAGTMEEWNTIDKDDEWNSDSFLETITCADGVITL